MLSFPKAGRTWIRFLLGNYASAQRSLELSPAECLEIERVTAELPGWPRLIVKHDRDCDYVAVSALERSVAAWRGEAVTLLVRDPRDVVVSWYFEKTRRHPLLWGREAACDGDITSFVRSEYGISLVLRWMRDWADQFDVPAKVRAFRYEDFRAAPENTVRALLEWLGVAIDDNALHLAVNASQFDAMRALEASGRVENRRLRAGDISDPESYKVRRGVVDGFREYLGADDVAYIESLMERELPACFGYAPHRGTD